MGWDPFKDAKKMVKKAKREISRAYGDLEDEFKRIDDNIKKLIPKPEEPAPLPTPAPPVGPGIPGDTMRRKAVKSMARSGRGGTILAGPLEPASVGKKKLLGGAK